MHVGERVKILAGGSYSQRYGPYRRCVGQIGTVVRHEAGPHYWTLLSVVRFADGSELACFEHEMEIMPAGEQTEE